LVLATGKDAPFFCVLKLNARIKMKNKKVTLSKEVKRFVNCLVKIKKDNKDYYDRFCELLEHIDSMPERTEEERNLKQGFVKICSYNILLVMYIQDVEIQPVS
jgi:nucleoid-associated protein YejK